jgi:hypothetical protein
MRRTIITLCIDLDDDSGYKDPGHWDWTSLTDSEYPVKVMSWTTGPVHNTDTVQGQFYLEGMENSPERDRIKKGR